MKPKFLVTGGTGLLGKEIVNQLIFAGKDVAILTTQATPDVSVKATFFNGDLITGKGLSSAVAGKDVIIHCASNPQNFEQTDILGTKNLLNAINKSQPPHLVYISIVGVDRSNYPYYEAKRCVEDLISLSGIPFTILRTTQFHPFVYKLIEGFLDTSKNILEIPEGMKFQSVSLGEVASKLISVAENVPSGLLPDYGGPEIMSFETMCQIYLDVFKRPILLQKAPLKGPRVELFRSGVNTCSNNAFGEITWATFVKNEKEKFSGNL